MRRCSLFIAALCFAIALAAAAFAQTAPAAAPDTAAAKAPEKPSLHIGEWLLLGPAPAPLPAFGDEGKKFDAAKLLGYKDKSFDEVRPAVGAASAILGAAGAWKTVAADTNGALLAPRPAGSFAAYLAAYIEADRWMKVTIEVRGTHPFEATLDGASIAKRDKAGKLSDNKSGEAKLEQGKHLLVVKTVFVPGDSAADWRCDARVVASSENGPLPSISLSPERILTLDEVLDAPRMSSATISPDGTLIALSMTQYVGDEGENERWLEIRSAKDGKLLRTMYDVTENVEWAPTGHRLSFVRAAKELSSLRVMDLDAGTVETIIEGVKDFDGYTWAKDGSFIVYSVNEKPEPDKSGVKRFLDLDDKTDYARNRSYLYLATVPGGATRRLTAGRYSTNILDISPDGSTILFSRGHEDLSKRPYEVTELFRMKIADQKPELLWQGSWFGGASYSPDGNKLLLRGGPSMFGPIGVIVPEGTIPNEYDNRAYLFDPETKTADPITKTFDKSIEDAVWSKANGLVYFKVEEASFFRVYRYDPKKRTFAMLDLGCDYIESFDIARDKPVAAFIGSGAVEMPRLTAIDLSNGKTAFRHAAAAEAYAGARPVTVESWSFTSDAGRTIEGYVYCPPGFDAQKKYPCIVYYYGGTMPTARVFGGRWPKNVWASMGYVVYILNPSGATGYGQVHSAFHVNDWGKVAGEEIIEGTQKFLDEHPFVARDRVGCIGASYGGFMTEYLVSRTKLFAAAVSHAGISNLTSYWGDGWWGWRYSAVATANSFPWDRRDIYIDQSPLFSADKITTPLLLLHGSVDTNVPPGESMQLYTALKLLGRPVEYVQIQGENHIVMDYKARKIWTRTIMAWFDRYLKNQPDWWNELYPPLEAVAGAAKEPAALPEPIGVRTVERPGAQKILVGEITRDDIVANIPGWDEEYYGYAVDENLIGEIAGLIQDVDIVVVLGTWCSDSHREVPRFWKMIETAGFPAERMKTFGVLSGRAQADTWTAADLVDYSKRLKGFYNVTAVESIIVYRGGKELGRIVEAPAKSIEADLLELLKK